VPVGTIKRSITGRGNADKDSVIAAVRTRGYNPADDNEADAIAIFAEDDRDERWCAMSGGALPDEAALS
jgi:hypothetical protein